MIQIIRFSVGVEADVKHIGHMWVHLGLRVQNLGLVTCTCNPEAPKHINTPTPEHP